MRTLAIIPARAGSKGIPGKNTFPILGKPLIAYSIESALQSKRITTVIVSSDDQKVQEITKRYQGILYHNRPSKLAEDSSNVIDTIFDIFNNFFDIKEYDSVILLQPTSPLRTGSDIDEAIEIFEKENNANSLVSVCAMNDVHPARMYWIKEGYLESIMPEFEKSRRQDIPTAYYRNGAIYLTRIKALLKDGCIVAKPTLSYEMPESKLLNIDTPRDLMIAEILIKAWRDNSL